MSQLPPAPTSSSAVASASNVPPAGGPVSADAPQPVVRVMRLYKPAMYVGSPMPELDIPHNRSKKSVESDFSLSNYLLLPDSFGDIYLGELFSAYVSVVNGMQDGPFTDVQLSVRLQTASSTHDLFDTRSGTGQLAPSPPQILSPNEFTDTIVEHSLSVVGTHTLRVSVQYSDFKTLETKTLRKFYRFNVLNPLLISSTVLDVGNKFYVQSQLTNCTRALLHIEEVNKSCFFRKNQV